MPITEEQRKEYAAQPSKMTNGEVVNLIVKTVHETVNAVCKIARHQAEVLKEIHKTNDAMEPNWESLETLCKIIEKEFK